MSWGLRWTGPALRDLRRLDRQVADRVMRDVRRLAETERGRVKRLEAVRPPEWRLAVGDWRVRFRFEDGTVVVLRVLPRGRAYRD